MKSVKSSGKTIDEAILMAVAQLGVQREKLDIRVIQQPEKGILGFIGNKEAKIEASIKKTIGEHAKEFLMQLIEKLGMDAIVQIKETNDKVYINLKGKDMGLLIGYRGETLDSVQYLTSLVVNKDNDEYKRIIIDTENYRSKREETLKRLAKRLAGKVQRSKKKVVLEPMNPYERRIIHSALQSDPYINTFSEGQEPYRKVVIDINK